MGERVRRRRGRRIQEILAVAAALFGERGYDGVSLDDVADRLDVTKGSLYYYFSSKDELVTAAIEALGNDWIARLERLVADTGGPAGRRLRALIHEQVTVAVRDHPAALRLFLAPDEWPDRQRERIKDLRRRHDRVFRDVVRDGVESGEFMVTSEDTALLCMHAAMTQAPTWYGALRPRARDLAIAGLVDTLMLLVGERPGH
jgi:AcrR family transcriptional regulator